MSGGVTSTPLTRALAPVMHILSDPKTEDLAIQQPGVGWWMHSGTWHRVDIPEMTYARLHGISVMAAAQTRQVINHRNPILTADLLGDLRLEALMPPCQPPGTMALTFRRGDMALKELEEVPRLFDTSRMFEWDKRKDRQRVLDGALLDRFDAGDTIGFLQGLIDTGKTGLLVGPMGAGKTTLSKILGGIIPLHKRIITIEDAAELAIRQPNNVRHFYSATGQGVSAVRLMKSTKRERPDIIMLAEMRDPDAAYVFLDEIMSGHPGSLSTVHGKTAAEAAKRVFNMVMTSSLGQSADVDVIAQQLGSCIDFIIPIENDNGFRSVGEMWFRPHAERRGETFRDLLKETA
jgi:type IV secretion system protein VirB11